MNSTLIHIARNGEEIGSWPLDLVQTMRTTGSLKPTDHWWSEGLADWQPLLTLPQPVQPAAGVKKSPLLAAILSLLLPGLGHIYIHHFAAGALFILCFLGTGATLLTLDELRSQNTYLVALLAVFFVLYCTIDSARKAR